MSRFAVVMLLLLGYGAFAGLSSRIEAVRRMGGADNKRPLEGLDYSPAGWSEEELESDNDLLRLTGADACVRRRFSRETTYLDLTLTHYTHAATGLKHSADVCFTGAGWTLTDRHKSRTDRHPDLAIDVMEFRRHDARATVGSTFLLGSGSYATQPEAKFALAREAGLFGSCALVYVEVAGWTSGQDSVDHAMIVDVVADVASRLRPAASSEAGF